MDNINWLWGIVGNWVAEWTYPYIKGATAFVGGFVMAWAKSRNWPKATPLLYGLVTSVCLYTLLGGFGSFSSQREDAEELRQQMEQRKHAMVNDEILRLRRELFRIPRPCMVKVTAPQENMPLRLQLLSEVRNSRIPYLNRSEKIIAECEVIEDEKDTNPNLYPDQPNPAPPGIIIIHTSPSQSEVAEFLALLFRQQTGFKVRSGTVMPPSSPEHLIYIQIGPGNLR